MQIHKAKWLGYTSLLCFATLTTAHAQTFEETIPDNDVAPITVSAETAVNRKTQSWRTFEAEEPASLPAEQAENTPPPALEEEAPLKVSQDTAVNRETQSWETVNAEATPPAEQNVVITAEEIQALQQEQKAPTEPQPVASTEPMQAQNILPPVSSDEASAGTLLEMQQEEQQQDAPRAENTSTPEQNIVITAEEIQALQEQQAAEKMAQATAEDAVPPVASEEITSSELQQVARERTIAQEKRASAARNKVIKVSKNTPPAQEEINAPLPKVVVEAHPKAHPLKEHPTRKVNLAANAPLPEQEPLAILPAGKEVHQSKYYLLASAKRGLEKPSDVILIIAHETNDKGLKVEEALLNMGLDSSQIQVVPTKAPLPQKGAVYLYRHS